MSADAQIGWFVLGAIAGWLVAYFAYRKEPTNDRHF